MVNVRVFILGKYFIYLETNPSKCPAVERKSIIKQMLSIKFYYHSKQIYEGALDPVDNLRTMQLICGSNWPHVFDIQKNVYGPIAVLVANRFRLEQKSYLPLKLQFMSGFGKTTIFNSLLGNRPDFFYTSIH
jgi:hypothetical protein